MSKTTEGLRRERFTSPTTVAPVLVGLDGADGGRDALELARVLGSLRHSRCVAAPGRHARPRCDSPRPDRPRRPRQHGRPGASSPTLRGRGRAARYASALHTKLARIVVAVDGTEESTVAMTRAEDLARQAGGDVEVPVASDPVVSGVEAEYPPDAPSSVSDVLQAALASVDPALHPSGRRVSSGWHQTARTVASALAKACSSEVDLLVAGSHSRSDQFLLGSVTKHLITEAACPVLIVPGSE